MESYRGKVLRALVKASIAISDFSITMQAATEGDEKALAYRSLDATTNAPPLDADTYSFLKNPPVDKMGAYFENVSELTDTVCTLKSSMPSDKSVPNLVGTIDEASGNWLGYEMCVSALHNIKMLQDSLADDSGDGCPICLEQFVGSALSTTICGHKFCTTCWEGWKAELNGRILTCPLCRKGQPASYDPNMLQLGPPSVHGGAADSTDGRFLDNEEPIYRSLAHLD